MKFRKYGLTAGCAIGILAIGHMAPASARDFTISSSLPQVHFWTGEHMDRFADSVEKNSKGKTKFSRFYAGELVKVGGGLDALNAGTVDVVAPLLAPYHAGRFPLSDITQLPVYNTSPTKITKAFQKLLDSKIPLKDGKTYYQYEIASKGIRAWPLGGTGAYTISTTGKTIAKPQDFKGLPLRAGTALQTITLENLGVNPVTMKAAQAYEALSRKTIEGILLSVADWKSYSLMDLLKYTIDGVALGHWESYLAISNEAWKRLSDEQKQAWDKIARKTALDNAAFIEKQESIVRKAVAAKKSKFVQVTDLSPEMQAHIGNAAKNTWIKWIEKLEKGGHPARKAAKIWADLIVAEGGKLPQGISDYLSK